MKIMYCGNCGSIIPEECKGSCVICAGIHGDSIVLPVNREFPFILKCAECDKFVVVESEETLSKLAFVNMFHMMYYCGCRGWD